MDAEILDTPLETDTADRPSRMAIVSSRLDFGVNVFLLIAWACCLIGGLVTEWALGFLAVVHFFLGVYQLGSTLVGAIRRQRPKLYYLLGVIAYFMFLAVIFAGLGMNGEFFYIFFMGVLPFFGAIYYLKLSYDLREKLAAYD